MPFLTQGKANWKFLLIVIVLAVIAGGGILSYLRTIEIIEKPVEEPVVEGPEILPEKKVEITDWQTYRNEEYGFEVKYPSEYRISEETATDVAPAIKAGSYAQIIFRNFTGYFTKEEIENKKTNFQKIKVGSLEAFSSPLGGNMDGGVEFDVLFFDHPEEGMIFNILFSTLQPEREQEIDIFNQIVSTFRFVKGEISTADWVGVYKYNEFAPPDQTWVYSLEIYQEGERFGARLDIDGFQTLARIQAIAEEHNGNLDIIFNGYRPENIGTFDQGGNLLFSLEKTSEENYKIIWNKLQSNLLEPGTAEFKKISTIN